jgi:hypothetical protein
MPFIKPPKAELRPDWARRPSSSASSVTAVEDWQEWRDGLPFQPPRKLDPLTEQRYSSYSEYINENALFWPELRFMKDFFSTSATQPCAETTVTIWDSTGEGVLQEEFSSADFQRLGPAIQKTPSSIRTRIIFIYYETSRTLDRHVVDILGQAFDIDPLSFRSHLLDPEIRIGSTEYGKRAMNGLPQRTLPSETHHSERTIEIPYDELWHISVQYRPRNVDNPLSSTC